MRTFVIPYLICWFLAAAANAQNVSAGKAKPQFIPGAFTSFSVDHLNNIYLLSTSNQLKKLNADGDSIAIFNDIKKFGEAVLADVSNPLKLLLYYKDFATVAVLDGMLNLKTTIDLRRHHMFAVDAVGLSYDGKIWLYDKQENTLKKIDERGKVILKTPDLRQMFGEAVSPAQIFDQSQFVYLCDPQHGIYVFDYYGAFKNRIPIAGWKGLRIAERYVLGADSSHLLRYNMKTLTYEKRALPVLATGYRQIFFTSDLLYVLRNEGLEIHSITAAKESAAGGF